MTMRGKRSSGKALLLLALAQCCAAAAHATGICDARSYGAKADGTTKDTLPLQRAIDDRAHKGGGVVRLTRGTYLSGPILLKSHVAAHDFTVHAASGAPFIMLDRAQVKEK